MAEQILLEDQAQVVSSKSVDEEGIHLHCLECHKDECLVHSNCKVVQCEHKCGIKLHKCKQKDHNEVCLSAIKPCINAQYGCPYLLPQGEVGKHLPHCPASVVCCGMEWNRYPVYCKISEPSLVYFPTSFSKYPILNKYEQKIMREHWVPFSQRNPVKVQGDLDMELAFHDQSKLEKAQMLKMKRGMYKVKKLKQESKLQIAALNPMRIELLKSLLCPCKKDSISSNDYLLNETVPLSEDTEGKSLPLKSSNSWFGRENIPSPGCIASIDKVVYSTNMSKTNSGSQGSITEGQIIVNSAEESGELAKEAVIKKNSQYKGYEFPPKLAGQKITPYFTKNLGLSVTIDTLPKFQKQYPMYNFACLQEFRRDQYARHFEHVHGDIHGGLNGWLLERCPLAQFGCPFVRYRLKPFSQKGKLVFSQNLGSFGVTPVAMETLYGVTRPPDDNSSLPLLTLPPELLETLASYLDSFSLNNLALTCKALRDVCQLLLKKHGIVVLNWEKRAYSDGSSAWKLCQKERWFYSTAFSDIHKWEFTDEPPLSNHLQQCPFFVRHGRKEKYQFPVAGLEAELTARVSRHGCCKP